MDITKEYTNGELTVYGRLANAFILVIVFAQSDQPKEKTFDKKLMLRHLKNKRNGRQMSIGCIDLFLK
jgi:hypothetical protein